MQKVIARWPVRNRSEDTGIVTPRVGKIVDVTIEGRVVVDYEGNKLGPLEARCLAGTFSADPVLQPMVVLIFEHGDPSLPIIIGVLLDKAFESNQLIELTSRRTKPRDIVLDGERLLLKGEKEIVLRCGDGSITLKADGKIILKGKELVSRASKTNRIKGSSVNIN
jgi:hypothetical protein